MRATRAFPCIILWLSNFSSLVVLLLFVQKWFSIFPVAPGTTIASLCSKGKCFPTENARNGIHLGFLH
uniref:Putative secreted protein n=1 Tax=Anopheles darlingi TaxID=43151 RepID=A0A2M4D7U0_ANODA